MKFFNTDRMEGLTEESKQMLLEINADIYSDKEDTAFDTAIYDS